MIDYHVLEFLGILGKSSSNGWRTECNIASLNGSAGYFEIRRVQRDTSGRVLRFGPGITLNLAQCTSLIEILESYTRQIKADYRNDDKTEDEPE